MSRRASYAFGSLLDLDPRGTITCGIGVGTTKGPHHLLHLADRPDHRDRATAREIAGLEFEFLYAPDTEAPEEMHIWIPRAEGAHLRREREPLAAQHPDAARRPDPRRPQLRPLPRRDARAVGRRGRGALRPAHLAGVGQRESSRSSSPSATPTSTSTTRRCGTRTRGTRRWRRPRSSSCRRRCAASGSTAATTARCTTTCAPCTPRNSACGTATRSRCTRTRRSTPPPGTSSSSAPTGSSTRAGAAFDAGDYRWAVEILHKLVFADPDHAEARDLQADAYEQLGYQVEGPQWRGIFLTAARELREGVQPAASPPPARTRSSPCRSTSCSTSSPCTHRRRRPPTPTCGSTSPSPTTTRRGRCGWSGVLNARQGRPPRRPSRCPGPRRPWSACCCSPRRRAQLADAGQITLDGDGSVLHMRRHPRRVRPELQRRDALTSRCAASVVDSTRRAVESGRHDPTP